MLSCLLSHLLHKCVCHLWIKELLTYLPTCLHLHSKTINTSSGYRRLAATSGTSWLRDIELMTACLLHSKLISQKQGCWEAHTFILSFEIYLLQIYSDEKCMGMVPSSYQTALAHQVSTFGAVWVYGQSLGKKWCYQLANHPPN